MECTLPYIFSTMSTKNSVSLLDAFAEPPYFSAAAVIAESPIPFPLFFVERYPSFPFRTFPSKLLVETTYSLPWRICVVRQKYRETSGTVRHPAIALSIRFPNSPVMSSSRKGNGSGSSMLQSVRMPDAVAVSW